MIPEKEIPLILRCYEMALAALRDERCGENDLFPWLAATACAQAIQETGHFSSLAFLKECNWFGISPVGKQPCIMGTGGNRIRAFVAEAEARERGESPDMLCFAAWAYLVVMSTNYKAARAEMLAVYDVTHKKRSATKAWIHGMAQVYCPGDPNYANDVINLFEHVLPVLFRAGKLTEG